MAKRVGREAMKREQWREHWVADHHQRGHEPYAAPTKENPEQWECTCDPDAVWVAVWRVLRPSRSRRSSYI
ncbi:hypothetical protein [Mycobacterium asiaticum]|uniref:hypothetical protein n=1 Tax=Mycobacterium asiaticum TaxID=1790 RepID=UPI0011DDFD63|nr:hypothetical protein [Mycobacterium asiaticum]